MMRVPFVDLRAQHDALASELHQAIADVLERSDFILGREVSLFEEEFSAYCGARWAVGVDSGTSALELALRALGVGPGDEVITAANTFVATAAAIAYTGATPVLVDVNPQTYTIDVSLAESEISSRTRAIIPVHLYGHPADMDPLMELAERHRLAVVEDACQAHGARYKGQRVGSIGRAAAFSFYPSKNLGACGDGGMVTTNDEEVARCVRLLRDHGQNEKYNHILLGYNRRLDTIQAAVLRLKLRHLDEWNTGRQRLAVLYTRLLADTRVTTPVTADYAEPVWHLYVIRTAERDALREYLISRGISVAMHYPIPIHMQPAFSYLGYENGSFPVTEEHAGEILSLPMCPEVGEESLEYVVETIREFLQVHSEMEVL
jgi:dTDP-4-amino-4,6-dideoxygalactose transaminase